MSHEFEDAYTDAKVAGVAAVCTVGLTVAFFALSVGSHFVARLLPLAGYVGYQLFGKGHTGSAVENPAYWTVGTVALTVVVFLAYALTGG